VAPKRLGSVRKAEPVASLMVLGVSEHIQLGYPAGCAQVPTDDAVGRLSELIAEMRPHSSSHSGPTG
jgi:LmbE family N-acetylglucosaminyl deacetylase